jgi:glutamine synthetase
LNIFGYDEGLPNVEDLPLWSYDGSSTKQAEGSKSDCLLKPVRVIRDPQRTNAYLVMCEVLNPDNTSHMSNTRNTITEDSSDVWFGFEQEYTLIGENGRPLGFPEHGHPEPQGKYYCGIGNRNVVGREIAEEHLNICLEAGLEITGINAEVMIGQWEYQLLSSF